MRATAADRLRFRQATPRQPRPPFSRSTTLMRPQGLLFVAKASEQEAMDLHGLYHGHARRGI